MATERHVEGDYVELETSDLEEVTHKSMRLE